jgi:hypothetical protein
MNAGQRCATSCRKKPRKAGCGDDGRSGVIWPRRAARKANVDHAGLFVSWSKFSVLDNFAIDDQIVNLIVGKKEIWQNDNGIEK